MKIGVILVLRTSLLISATNRQSKCVDIRNIYKDSSCCGHGEKLTDHQILPSPDRSGSKIVSVNRCEGSKPSWIDANCSGGVYEGEVMSNTTILEPFWKRGMCAVNVHWHVGAEHRSIGHFDENSSRSPGANASSGFRCYHFDPSDAKYTTPYRWKYCSGMVVGETYEVQWPHSCMGACGTGVQYQSPYHDGLFCNPHGAQVTPEVVPDCVGVQAQVFTIVNDESYYFPDLMRGMIVTGSMGKNLSMYTTKSTSSDNQFCLDVSPVTWHVDSECHLISASSFDKMCADMLNQFDDMSEDVHPHVARTRTTTTTTGLDPCKDGFAGLTNTERIQKDTVVGSVTALDDFEVKFKLLLDGTPKFYDNIFGIAERVDARKGARSRNPACWLTTDQKVACRTVFADGEDATNGELVTCNTVMDVYREYEVAVYISKEGKFGIKVNDVKCGEVDSGTPYSGFEAKVILGHDKWEGAGVKLWDMTYCPGPASVD